MRQTGRTSRIINFVVEQLYNVGRCIATDHIVFEYEKVSQRAIHYFIERVQRRIDTETGGTKKVKSKIITIDELYMVDFKLEPIES
jgi:hypothetical protein